MTFNLIIFLIFAFALGFIAAMPVGPTQLEIARRSINGFPSSAIMLVAGSVISDTMYGFIAFFGIAPFLRDSTVIAIFWIINAVILVFLGIWAIKESKVDPLGDMHIKDLLRKRNLAFFTGFSLAITNPLMIIWWLLGAQLIIQLGLLAKFGTAEYMMFLLIGASGIASYLALFTFGVYKAKKFFTGNGIRKLTLAFGIILFGLAAYFLYKSAEIFIYMKVPSI